jgi:hypothetical protein
VKHRGRRHWPFSVAAVRWLPSPKLHHIFTVPSGLSMSPWCILYSSAAVR